MTDMNEASGLSQFQQASALRDGTPVLIRTARADDRERLVAAFNALDSQSVYTRYFSFRKGFSEAELGRLDAPDFEHFVLLVVTRGSGADETIIAGASYAVVDPTAPSVAAEVAFTVEEDYQGQGLASKLLTTITDIARSRGIKRLEADVLAVNKAMLSVFRRSGLPMTTSRDGNAVHLVLDLATPAPSVAGAAPR
jgi:RimJ/RimL family protein N-acetyltransferase